MSRARDRQHRWRTCHQGKRVYHSRWRAWRSVISTCVWNRRIDLRLRPYRCWWKNAYLERGGDDGPLHWHIGHARPSTRRGRRTWLNVHVIWPYYRARRWVRRRSRRADTGNPLCVGWTLAALWDRYWRWRREQENPLPVPLEPGDVAVVEELEIPLGPGGTPATNPDAVGALAYESVKRREDDDEGGEEAEEDVG